MRYHAYAYDANPMHQHMFKYSERTHVSSNPQMLQHHIPNTHQCCVCTNGIEVMQNHMRKMYQFYAHTIEHPRGSKPYTRNTPMVAHTPMALNICVKHI